jgi:2-haloacid dehalogenase
MRINGAGWNVGTTITAGRPVRRREFLQALGGTLAMSAPMMRRSSLESIEPRIRAVVFDGFAVFDATRVVTVADAIVPGRGRELVASWRARQFEYQWLRTLAGHYADFRRTAEDGLAYAMHALGLTLDAGERARLLDAQLTLVPWPDAVDSIRALRAAGMRLGFLSNMTAAMLDDGARRAGVRDAFEHVLTTDVVRAAKPDPRAYRMAVDAFDLRHEQIAFVAFAGWDAAGATWFAYPTVWTNRLSSPAEEMGVAPALVARDLDAVVRFVTGPA